DNPGETYCGNGFCVDLKSDTYNCGACGNICPTGRNALCCNGVCKGYSDPNNCGTCGQVCPAGVPCCINKCCGGGSSCCPNGTCCPGGCCPAGNCCPPPLYSCAGANSCYCLKSV